MKRFVLILVLSPLLFVLAAPAGFGDTIYLKNGSKFDGKLIEETASAYRFKIKGLGEQTFQKSKVLKVEIKETVFDQYEAKRKTLKKNDAEGHYQLGLWCKENGLKKEWKKCFKAAMAADGEHAGARAELGFVKYEGKWMKKEEMEGILAEIAAEEAGVIAGLKLGKDYVDEEARFAIGTPKNFAADEVDGLSVGYTGPVLGGVAIEIELVRTDSAGGLDTLAKDVKTELDVSHEDLAEAAPAKAADLSGNSGRMLSFSYAKSGMKVEHRVVAAVFPDFDLRLNFIFADGYYEKLKPFFDKVTASVRPLRKPADGTSEEWGFEFSVPDENYHPVDNFPINIQGVDWKAPSGTKTLLAAAQGYMVVIAIFPGKKSDTSVDSSTLDTLRDSIPGSFPEQYGVKIQGESKSVKLGGQEALSGNMSGLGGVGRYAVVMRGDNHYRLMFMNIGNGMGQSYVSEDFEKFLAGFRFK